MSEDDRLDDGRISDEKLLEKLGEGVPLDNIRREYDYTWGALRKRLYGMGYEVRDRATPTQGTGVFVSINGDMIEEVAPPLTGMNDALYYTRRVNNNGNLVVDLNRSQKGNKLQWTEGESGTKTAMITVRGETLRELGLEEMNRRHVFVSKTEKGGSIVCEFGRTQVDGDE